MSYYDARILADAPAHYLAIPPDETGATFEDSTANDRDGTGVGGYSRGAASLLAGFPGDGAVNFDGSGRITTGYGTRRQRCTNPRAGALATTGWGGAATSGATGSLPTTTGLPEGITTGFVGAGSASGHDALHVFSVTAGETIRPSVYVRVAARTATSLRVRMVTGSGTLASLPETNVTAIGGDFVRIDLPATAVTGTGDVSLRLTQIGAGTIDFHWTAVLIDANASLRDYFDGDGHVDSGAYIEDETTGWLGTAHASASDKGALANGAPRSWEGWHKRADEGAAHTLFGSTATSNATRLVLASGSGNVLWIVNGTTYTFTDAWFGTDACYWAFAFDEANNTAELWVFNADTGESFHEEKTGVTAQHAAGQTLQWGAHGSGSDGFDGDAAKLAAYELLLSAGLVESHFEIGAVPAVAISFPADVDDYSSSHRFAVVVEALVDGEIERTIPITDGAVRLDSRATSQRSLDLTVPDDGTGELIPTDPASLLAPYGNELRVSRGIYLAGEAQLVSLGIFRIDRAPTDGETVRISGRDRSAIVIDATFEEPYTVASGAQLTDTIIEVITEGYPGLVVGANFIDVDIELPALIADEGDNRWAFAEGLATAAGCVVYFDDAGELALAPVPSNVAGSPIATFTEGDGVSLESNANLLSAEREWDREPVFNRIVVAAENTTADTVVRGVAIDDNPLSATYYYGSFGRKPMPPWTNPYLTSADQCATAAAAILAEKIGVPDSISFEALVYPERRPWDVVRINREKLGVAEDHVLDALALPLTPEGRMSASTRATQELS